MPCALVNFVIAFAPLFSKPVFERVKVLLVGAILSPASRTVTNALRVTGLSGEKHFQNYHRVLNRASWSSLNGSRILLKLLMKVFQLEDELVIGFDDHLERRRGRQIKAKGIYRDAVPLYRIHFLLKQVACAGWYGVEKEIEITSGKCVWFHVGKEAVPIRWVIVRDPAGEFDTQAVLGTNQEAEPKKIVEWFIKRWQVEVTFEESRRHLGIETNRNWSDKAIHRTTPCLFGLFSLVTMMAQELSKAGKLQIRSAVWYKKEVATFSDAIGCVRQQIWEFQSFQTSKSEYEMIKIPRSFLETLTDTLCFAA